MTALKPTASELERYLKSLKGKSLEASIGNIISLMKRRQIRGSESCAIATAHILLQVVAKTKFNDVDHMLEKVQRVGSRLAAAQPRELVIGNIVRRVLGLIRDEAAEDRNDAVEDEIPPAHPDSLTTTSLDTRQDAAADYVSSGPRPARPGGLTAVSSFPSKTLLSLLEAAPPADTPLGGSKAGSGASTPLRGPPGARVNALRPEVIDGIEEIKDEISQVDDQIATAADVQIHPMDHVLVHQPSPTVQKFILRAAAKRRFTVLISAESPHNPSQMRGASYAVFRKKLAASGITTIDVTSAGLTGHMSRVSKVVLGARSVLANGGVVMDAGASLIARAAKERGNPVIVLSGVYKFSPENSVEEESLTDWGSSMAHVSFADGPLVNGADVLSAVAKLVPSEQVDTYITNLGAHSKNHLSTIIADHYKQEDMDFQFSDVSNR